MNYRYLAFGSLFLIGSFPSTLLGETCKPTDPTDTLCTLNVAQVRPTQFAVGSVAVACKARKIGEKSKKKLQKYLAKEKRRIPAVIGPDGHFYMADHHHLSTALHQATSTEWDDSDKVLHIKILDNFRTNNAAQGEFWNTMIETHRSYLYDNKGIANMNFALLPADVSGLLNDPYRTLSRWVRESCGYVKAGKEQCDGIRTDHEHKAPFFMEFHWGNFFRDKLPLATKDLKVCQSTPYSKTCLDDEVAQLKGIYDKSMALAASEDAKKYFEAQGLDPWDYGFNPSGKHVQLEWSGDDKSCEEPVTQ